MTSLIINLILWLGGAMFAASLALTGWTYAFRFGQPEAWAGWSPVIGDLGLLSVFALHHSLFARPGMKVLMGRVCPERLLRSVYVWVASVLLILVCLFWQTVGGLLYESPQIWVAAIHVVIQLIGVWLVVRSVGAIDALELAGIRAASSASTGGLQVGGPYRLVRHPLYLGWILIVFGPARLTGDRLAFAAITTAYLLIAIPWEERSLEAVFGAAYRRYKARVRWRVLPFVY